MGDEFVPLGMCFQGVDYVGVEVAAPAADRSVAEGLIGVLVLRAPGVEVGSIHVFFGQVQEVAELEQHSRFFVVVSTPL